MTVTVAPFAKVPMSPAAVVWAQGPGQAWEQAQEQAWGNGRGFGAPASRSEQGAPL